MKSVTIIGAGIGGLATGCYLQMNGYDTQIFEMHDKPGDSARHGNAKDTQLMAAYNG